ncbi:TetR/AcrR family transcriptional regulator [Afipia massiliensis]|uniref:TetR/AcrR family transcriptional regulator n=1 Tax=Afipia massiliensis TaxID=211460 RepID=A0A4U6BJS2_9BRAD|nr:TetR/AcrR family transcriptional regulator [Afipia massiliensis]TKT70442.1 TetR/AcrR family transcriptional regulator [Afipia massiliensis]
MTMLHDDTDSEKKACILATAERLFREIGYLKTTVADIAKTLKMSPANIYRFFDSKKAIHEGVARRLMNEVETEAEAIAAKTTHPAVRLRELLSTVSRMNAERFVGDAKIHEMVAIAMEESWDVCEAHIQRITMAIASVIAEGAKTGVFKVTDIELAALSTCTAMLRFFHPQMIEQCAKKPGPTLDQMIDFILAALTLSASGTIPGSSGAGKVSHV